MQAEILMLFGVCFTAAIGELLLPQSTQNGTRTALRLLTSLIVLLLILAPFLRILKNQDTLLPSEITEEQADTEEFESIFEKALQAQSEADLKEGLLTLLQKEYGVKENDCQIHVFFDDEGELFRVSLFLSGKALLQDPLTIERDLAERLGCEVEVR